MRYFINAIRSIFRRPILIWFIAVILLPITYLSNKYSILTLIPPEQGLGSLNLFDTYLLILQIIVKFIAPFNMVVLVSITVIVFSILFGLLSGALFSGYFYILHKDIHSYRKKKDDFIKGLKKNFWGLFKATSISIFATTVVLALISFVFVPSIVTLNSLLAGKAELFFILVLFIIVTIFVLFFSFTFYRIYMLYWFPAVISFKKSSFKAGRYVANNNFWKSMINIIIFDLIFAFSRFIYFSRLISINSQEIISKAAENRLFIFNWLFLVIFVYLYIYYIFYSFKNSKDQVI